MELDDKDLRTRLRGLAEELGLVDEVQRVVGDDLVTEMCRYGASELHGVAAFVGGIAAQEAIKILTGQYVPVDNTLIFDGHTDNAVAYHL